MVPGLEISSIPPCKAGCGGREGEKKSTSPLGASWGKLGLGCGSFLATI